MCVLGALTDGPVNYRLSPEPTGPLIRLVTVGDLGRAGDAREQRVAADEQSRLAAIGHGGVIDAALAQRRVPVVPEALQQLAALVGRDAAGSADAFQQFVERQGGYPAATKARGALLNGLKWCAWFVAGMTLVCSVPLVARMIATTDTTASGVATSSAPTMTSFALVFMFLNIFRLLMR